MHDIAIRAYQNAIHSKQKQTPEEYFTEHPQVYRAFERFTLEALQAGRKKIGAKMILERMRWESYLDKTGAFKVNNNYGAAMARRFMAENPLFGQVFETREKKKDAS